MVQTAPYPQELALFEDPQIGEQGAEEPTLIILRPGAPQFPNFAGIPGFGRIPNFDHFPNFGSFPSSLPASFGLEESSPKISISLSDLFNTEPSENSGRVPSILSKLFNVLGEQLGVDVKNNEDKTITQEDDGEYDHHNNTYLEKVLSDGSVLRTNKTIIQDTDEDGNTFFFSSSVHHFLQDDNLDELDFVEEIDEENIDDTEEVQNEDNEEYVVYDNPRDYTDEAELIPKDIDETLNEIDIDLGQAERQAKNEFPGVDATSNVEGLFE